MACHILDVASGGEKHRYVVDASTDKAIGVRVYSDTVNRLNILPGKIEIGSGSAAVDVNLYRKAANKLVTDDAFGIASGNSGAPGLFFTVDTSSTGIYMVSEGVIGTAANGAQNCEFSTPTTSAGCGIGKVSAFIAGSASMRTVTIGAADSGGTGFRALVVANT